MTATGFGERTRWALPLGTALAAVVVAVLGLWQTAAIGSQFWLVMWLFVSPLLAVVAAASLVAVVQRAWSPRSVVVTIAAMAAAFALSAVFWMFTLPDEKQLPLPLFWGAGAGYLVLAGVAVAVALAPALQRQFSPVVGHVLGFACGVVGAVIATPATGAGLGFVVAGVVVIILVLRQVRHTRTRHLAQGSEQQ